ncbi:MAG: hypothetical protein HY064_16295 [Bacteroidetes bacterium]|nr:hypothetical protein [Bacteroidota bacterium]
MNAQFDTAAFRNSPGDLFCCTDDSSELLKDTIIFSKYTGNENPFLTHLGERCTLSDPAPYLFFQPGNDSVVFVYGFSGGKKKNSSSSIVTDEDSTDFEQRILILRGTWKFVKKKSVIEVNFPAWNTTLTWKVEDHPDYWLFIRKK